MKIKYFIHSFWIVIFPPLPRPQWVSLIDWLMINITGVKGQKRKKGLRVIGVFFIYMFVCVYDSVIYRQYVIKKKRILQQTNKKIKSIWNDKKKIIKKGDDWLNIQ